MRPLVFFLQLSCVFLFYSHQSYACLDDQKKLAGLYDDLKYKLETRLLGDLGAEAAKADNWKDNEISKLVGGAINYINNRDHFLFNDPIMIRLWGQIQRSELGTPEHTEAMTHYQERLQNQEAFLRDKYYPDNTQVPQEKIRDYPTLNLVVRSIIADRMEEQKRASSNNDGQTQQKPSTTSFMHAWRDFEKNDIHLARLQNRIDVLMRGTQEYEKAVQDYEDYVRATEAELAALHLPEQRRIPNNPDFAAYQAMKRSLQETILDLRRTPAQSEDNPLNRIPTTWNEIVNKKEEIEEIRDTRFGNNSWR